MCLYQRPLTVTTDGNKYIITAIEASSRFGFAEAVSTTTSDRVIRFIEQNIICKFGLPKKIVSDNGRQFIGEEFKQFAQKLNIQLVTTTDYHPQSNGLDERFNGSLVKILRNYITKNQKDWDRKLPYAVMNYNCTPNESTKFAPFTLVYGAEARGMNELSAPEQINLEPIHNKIRDLAKTYMKEAAEKSKIYYDLHHRPQDFELYDKVPIRKKQIKEGEAKKLTERWEGPAVIVKINYTNEEPSSVVVCDPLRPREKLRRLLFDIHKKLNV